MDEDLDELLADVPDIEELDEEIEHATFKPPKVSSPAKPSQQRIKANRRLYFRDPRKGTFTATGAGQVIKGRKRDQPNPGGVSRAAEKPQTPAASRTGSPVQKRAEPKKTPTKSASLGNESVTRTANGQMNVSVTLTLPGGKTITTSGAGRTQQAAKSVALFNIAETIAKTKGDAISSPLVRRLRFLVSQYHASKSKYEKEGRKPRAEQDRQKSAAWKGQFTAAREEIDRVISLF